MGTWVCKKGDLATLLPRLANELHPIELQVVVVLEKAALAADDDPNPSSRVIRIRLVINALSDLGSRLGYEPHAKWLFDVVWKIKRTQPWLPVSKFIAGSQWGSFDGLKLVCESEWDGMPDSFLHDFAKLTVANADHRLFVHSNQYYESELGNVSTVQFCESILRGSQGNRFLFVGFDWGRDRKPEFRIDLKQA